MRAQVTIALLLSLGFAGVARGIDGVIEINQARALAGGVTNDDDPGFPVSLSQAGSYRLTSDLTLPDGSTNGIIIGDSFVQIDLNGFAVRGPNTWAGGAASCSAGGNGRGIYSPSANNAVVSNGGVFGAGGSGIALYGRGNRVERVITEQNCGVGVDLGEASMIIDAIARRNYTSGFSMAQNGRVSGSIADANGSYGIFPYYGYTSIERCVVTGNTKGGINAGPSTLVRHSQVNNNGGNAIYATAGSLVLDNAINGHPNTAILGASPQLAQVGTGGNVVSYGAGGSGFFYLVHLYCDLENGAKLCAP
ncbi:MAG: right-handed parallel beta-helix repeat-containing protein [bacterium]